MMKYLALSFLYLAFFLTRHPVEGEVATVSFSLSTATASSYKSFIANLRTALPKNGSVCGIPLLLSTISDSRRFILINLSNYDGQTITAAIDVLNVYIVAYSNGLTSYFFQGSYFSSLFKGTQHIRLPYTGNYENLQTAAHKRRENIELGLPALDTAITTLFYYNAESAPSAFIVLIQTTSEAARYKYIELQIANNVATKFLPSLTILSLENNWSALSKQIQIANNNKNEQFETPVILIDLKGNPVSISNVTSRVVTENIKLLLNIGNKNVGIDDSAVIKEAIMPSKYGCQMGRKFMENEYSKYVTV